MLNTADHSRINDFSMVSNLSQHSQMNKPSKLHSSILDIALDEHTPPMKLVKNDAYDKDRHTNILSSMSAD